MQNYWIFEYDDYREIVAKRLKEEAKNRGYRSDMARAAGCQLAYINHVLNNSAQFTPDHAMGIAEFWALDELETEYFLALVDLARAATPRLKIQIEKKLAKLRREYQKNRNNRLSIEPYDRERVIEYYLDWAVSATHALLMVPQFRESTAIAKRLQIEESRITSILKLLQDLGFAEKIGNQWKTTSQFFHAGDENKFANLHHRNWRQQVSENLNKHIIRGDAFHYTAIHTLSEEDFKKIRKMLTEFIAQTREVVMPSPEKTVACMTLDWFEL